MQNKNIYLSKISNQVNGINKMYCIKKTRITNDKCVAEIINTIIQYFHFPNQTVEDDFLEIMLLKKLYL
jgi:hypothetical protein